MHIHSQVVVVLIALPWLPTPWAAPVPNIAKAQESSGLWSGLKSGVAKSMGDTARVLTNMASSKSASSSAESAVQKLKTKGKKVQTDAGTVPERSLQKDKVKASNVLQDTGNAPERPPPRDEMQDKKEQDAQLAPKTSFPKDDEMQDAKLTPEKAPQKDKVQDKKVQDAQLAPKQPSPTSHHDQMSEMGESSSTQSNPPNAAISKPKTKKGHGKWLAKAKDLFSSNNKEPAVAEPKANKGPQTDKFQDDKTQDGKVAPEKPPQKDGIQDNKVQDAQLASSQPPQTKHHGQMSEIGPGSSSSSSSGTPLNTPDTAVAESKTKKGPRKWLAKAKGPLSLKKKGHAVAEPMANKGPKKQDEIHDTRLVPGQQSQKNEMQDTRLAPKQPSQTRHHFQIDGIGESSSSSSMDSSRNHVELPSSTRPKTPDMVAVAQPKAKNGPRKWLAKAKRPFSSKKAAVVTQSKAKGPFSSKKATVIAGSKAQKGPRKWLTKAKRPFSSKKKAVVGNEPKTENRRRKWLPKAKRPFLSRKKGAVDAEPQAKTGPWRWLAGATERPRKWLTEKTKGPRKWLAENTKGPRKWLDETTKRPRKWLDESTKGFRKWLSNSKLFPSNKKKRLHKEDIGSPQPVDPANIKDQPFHQHVDTSLDQDDPDTTKPKKSAAKKLLGLIQKAGAKKTKSETEPSSSSSSSSGQEEKPDKNDADFTRPVPFTNVKGQLSWLELLMKNNHDSYTRQAWTKATHRKDAPVGKPLGSHHQPKKQTDDAAAAGTQKKGAKDDLESLSQVKMTTELAHLILDHDKNMKSREKVMADIMPVMRKKYPNMIPEYVRNDPLSEKSQEWIRKYARAPGRFLDREALRDLEREAHDGVYQAKLVELAQDHLDRKKAAKGKRRKKLKAIFGLS